MLSSISSSSGTDSTPSSPPNGSLKGSNRSEQHLSLTEDLLHDTKKVELDGYVLSLGEVVAVGRNGVEAAISDDEGIKGRIEESVEFLRTKVSSYRFLSVSESKKVHMCWISRESRRLAECSQLVLASDKRSPCFAWN